MLPKRHALNQSPLYRLRSRKKLAELLGLTRKQLEKIAATQVVYRERQIETKKANGKIKVRLTQEPRGELRAIHERIKRLLSRIEPPGFLFCPVKQRSYVNNAAVHSGAREVRTVDVKDYFTSTPRRRAYWFFHSVMDCETDVAAVLARLLTVKGHLPTGSPVSPILAFYAFFDMWHAMATLAEECGCKITVYMDDLTISGNVVPEWLMWQIRRRIFGSGLRYHKERRFTGQHAEVTGVVLRDGKTILPNRQRKRAHDLRGELKGLAQGVARQAVLRRLRGLQAQQRQVEGAFNKEPSSTSPAVRFP
jgi:hypothetical protein